MPKHQTKNRRKKKASSFSWQNLVIVGILFSLVGGYLIYRSLAAPNPNLQGDLNNDYVVNIFDLSILLSNYGTTNPAADIDGNGQVNITDLSIQLSNYGRTGTPPVINTAYVSITSSGFVPGAIGVSPNTQIIWTNNDSANHQVAADPHPAHDSIVDFDSDIVLGPGDSTSFIFETPGTYNLHDDFKLSDNRFKLTVIVQ